MRKIGLVVSSVSSIVEATEIIARLGLCEAVIFRNSSDT